MKGSKKRARGTASVSSSESARVTASIVSGVDGAEPAKEKTTVPAATAMQEGPPANKKAKKQALSSGAVEKEVIQVRAKEELIKQSKKNHNEIVHLIEIIEHKRHDIGSVAVVIASSQSLRRVFNKLVADGDLKMVATKATQTHGHQIKAQYRNWLKELYKRYLSSMMPLLHHTDVRLQVASLHTLMDFVKMEWRYTGILTSFSSVLFEQVILLLTTCSVLSEITLADFISKFVMKYTDLRYYSLIYLKKWLTETPTNISTRLRKLLRVEGGDADEDEKEEEEKKGKQDKDKEKKTEEERGLSSMFDHDAFCRNCVEMLLRLKIPDGASEPEEWFALKPKDGQAMKKGQFSFSKQALLLDGCWMGVLTHKCPVDVYKDVLTHMHKHIMPGLKQPLLLADFLTDAFNKGGVVSVLSLDGLFELITKHNLDYPNYYTKLYNLCTPAVLHVKYRHRFFRLLALSLSSKGLASYLVCSFAKRLGRLGLAAPPGALVFITTLLFNLIRRHPTCNFLIDREDVAKKPVGSSLLAFLAEARQARQNNSLEVEVESLDLDKDESNKNSDEDEGDEADDGSLHDPFLVDEGDPFATKAMQSSLWELKTLENHYISVVSRKAKEVFCDNARKTEYDIMLFTQESYQTVIENELTWRKNQKMPTNFDKPEALFSSEGALGSILAL